MYVIKKDELKLFYLLDKHFYLVKDNPVLLKVLDTLEQNYQKGDVQFFIDRIISWYTIKYSNTFLNSLFDDKKETDLAILDVMNFDTFRKRYCAFEDELFHEHEVNNAKIILQKYLVVMAGWGLIYHKDSNPRYGYYRAKQMLNDFNSFYNWSLPSSIYHNVLEKDYSLSNEDNVRILEELEKKKYGNKKHNNKKKKLFCKRIFFD